MRPVEIRDPGSPPVYGDEVPVALAARRPSGRYVAFRIGAGRAEWEAASWNTLVESGQTTTDRPRKWLTLMGPVTINVRGMR